MSARKPNLTTWSLLIFGSYAMIMGLVLLFLPGQVLPMVGLREHSGTWVHVLGFVLCCSAYYYLCAGRSGNRDFARLNGHTRLLAPSSFWSSSWPKWRGTWSAIALWLEEYAP